MREKDGNIKRKINSTRQTEIPFSTPPPTIPYSNVFILETEISVCVGVVSDDGLLEKVRGNSLFLPRLLWRKFERKCFVFPSLRRLLSSLLPPCETLLISTHFVLPSTNQ